METQILKCHYVDTKIRFTSQDHKDIGICSSIIFMTRQLILFKQFNSIFLEIVAQANEKKKEKQFNPRHSIY